MPGATNGVTYHLIINVDYLTKIMSVTTGNSTTIFSGTNFDKINQNTGGGIGLISWNDNITFDNVVLSSSTVPEPGTFLLLGSGLLGILGVRRLRY